MPNTTLSHPDLPDIEVPEPSVRIHERAGWSRKAPSKAKATKAPAAKKAPAPVADPPTTNSPDTGEES